MGIFSNIFKHKEQTIEDYMKNNQEPVVFKKLYYIYPTKRVSNENIKKEYFSYNEFANDYPEHYYRYSLKKSKHIIVNSGFFFYFRGNYHNYKSIKECLSKLIGLYMNDNWYGNPKDKCKLIPKEEMFDKFSNSNCFFHEIGEGLKIEFFKVKNKFILVNNGYISNKYSILSVGDVDNKPIMFGDKMPLINLEEINDFFRYVDEPEMSKEIKGKNIPELFNIHYGYIIDYYVGNGAYRGIYEFESLLRRKDVTIDLLKQEKIDIDKYLDSFTKQSRKIKLEKLMKINKEI